MDQVDFIARHAKLKEIDFNEHARLNAIGKQAKVDLIDLDVVEILPTIEEERYLFTTYYGSPKRPVRQ